MQNDVRLLIPLSDLPGPVPAGAPFREWRVCGKCSGVGYVGDEVRTWALPWSRRVCPTCPTYIPLGNSEALDLSPPPLNKAGYPTRIDGLDVAASMLAQSVLMLPYPIARRATWAHEGDGTWSITGDGSREAWGVWGDAFQGHVPALADIAPHHELSSRLALAAVIRAAPWSQA